MIQHLSIYSADLRHQVDVQPHDYTVFYLIEDDMSSTSEDDLIYTYIRDYAPSIPRTTLSAELREAGVDPDIVVRVFQQVYDTPPSSVVQATYAPADIGPRSVLATIAVAGLLLETGWSLVNFWATLTSDNPNNLYFDWPWIIHTFLQALGFLIPLSVFYGLHQRWRIRTLTIILLVGISIIIAGYKWWFRW
jgi:hypothetical protein